MMPSISFKTQQTSYANTSNDALLYAASKEMNSANLMVNHVSAPPPSRVSPAWLESWINGWLSDQQQPQQQSTGVIGAANGEHQPSLQAPPPLSIGIEEVASINATTEMAAAMATACSELTSRRDSTSSSSPMDELSVLRFVDNRQKERIQELHMECARLHEEAERWKAQALSGAAIVGTTASSSPDHTLTLAAQNRFLNAELLRINDRYSETERQLKQNNS